MEWISVNKLLPGYSSQMDYFIVRCINSDYSVFYFMASYSQDYGWSYFTEDDMDYEKTMKITHWGIPDEVEEQDLFFKED